MLAEVIEVAESRRSLQVMQADLDSIEEQLQLTNRRLFKADRALGHELAQPQQSISPTSESRADSSSGYCLIRTDTP